MSSSEEEKQDFALPRSEDEIHSPTSVAEEGHRALSSEDFFLPEEKTEGEKPMSVAWNKCFRMERRLGNPPSLLGFGRAGKGSS